MNTFDRCSGPHCGVMWLLPLLLVGLVACVGAPEGGVVPEKGESGSSARALPQGATAMLSLTVTEQGAEHVVVEVRYDRAADATGPRMMELLLRPSDGLAYVSSEALASVTGADKQLVVQEQEGATLRTVVFATTNTNRLGPGPIARYRFKRTGAGGTAVEFIESRPVFAPPEADVGLVLGKPVTAGER